MKKLNTEYDVVLFSLSTISQSLHQLNKKAEKDFGISLVQWGLLKKLIETPACPANLLAQKTGVQPGTLTQTLKRLQRRRLIFIDKDPKDSRKKIIALTRLGKESLDRAQPVLTEWTKPFFPLQSQLFRLSKELKNQMGGEL